MLKKALVSIFFLIFILNNNLLFSKDIPIIVIAPSKKPQSASTVGTSVVVLDEEYLKSSNEYFLGMYYPAVLLAPISFKTEDTVLFCYSIKRATKKIFNCVYRWSKKCQIRQVFQAILILIIF